MRFLERFLIVFAFIALLMRIWAIATAPVFLLLGFPALALYYLFAISFAKLKGKLMDSHRGWAIVIRIASGVLLAFCITGFLLYILGWINRADVWGNCCIGLTVLAVTHGVNYHRSHSGFSGQVFLRAAIMLAIVILTTLLLPQFAAIR